MNKDSLGDRMKDYESRFKYKLPRRAYTIIRLDGKAFHNYTKYLDKPFDLNFVEDMIKTTLYLCKNIQGCKFGYVQSDEISLLLTDFDDISTDAWFDGSVQKIVSVSASMATAKFNQLRLDRKINNQYVSLENFQLANFDSRTWSLSDPWEVFNTFLWRQQDATRNSIQMVARALASHKECNNKNTNELQELIFQKGQNYNDYPIYLKRGTFVYKDEKWLIDRNMPILTQDRDYFFSKLPTIYNKEVK